MKNTKTQILIALVSLLSAFSAKAQTNVYHPFPDSANYFWGIKYYVFDEGCMCTHNYSYYQRLSDTIIHWHNQDYRFVNQSQKLIRQNINEKKVYARIYDVTGFADTTEYILYDFNLIIGDSILTRINTPFSISNPNLRYLHCTAIDSVETSTGFRKRLKMELFELPYWSQFTSINYDYWIEGIGSAWNLFYEIPPCLDFECQMTLGCFGKFNTSNTIHEGDSIYGIYCNDFFTVGLENINSVDKLRIIQYENTIVLINPMNIKILDVSIYDIIGNKIKQVNFINELELNDLSSGIYIVKINTDSVTYTKKIVIN